MICRFLTYHCFNCRALQTRVKEVFTDYTHDKFSRDKALRPIIDEVKEQMKERFGTDIELTLQDSFDRLTYQDT